MQRRNISWSNHHFPYSLPISSFLTLNTWEMVFEAELHPGTCREVPNRPWKIKNWKWPNCCQIFANCSSAELLSKTWHQRQAASLVQHFSQSLHSSCCKTFEEFKLAIKELIYKHLIAEPWHLRSWFLNWVKGKKRFLELGENVVG